MSGFNIGGYTSEKDSITVSSQDFLESGLSRIHFIHLKN
jgi:hypothetical protein